MKTNPNKLSPDYMQRCRKAGCILCSTVRSLPQTQGNPRSPKGKFRLSHAIITSLNSPLTTSLSTPYSIKNSHNANLKERVLGSRYIRRISCYFGRRVGVCRLGFLVLARLLLLFLGSCFSDQLFESHVIALFFGITLCLFPVSPGFYISREWGERGKPSDKSPPKSPTPVLAPTAWT